MDCGIIGRFDPAMARRMLAAISILAMFAVPQGVRAQVWQFHQFDDGLFFDASISVVGGSGFALICGGRFPWDLSAIRDGDADPLITPPDVFRMTLKAEVVGLPAPGQYVRQDVMFVIGATGYQLHSVEWDEIWGGWAVSIHAKDAMLSSLAQQTQFEIRSGIGSRLVSATGFGAALAHLTAHCQAKFASVGRPFAPAVTGSPPTPGLTIPRLSVPGLTMRQYAEAAIARGCNGPATFQPGGFLSGEIDGDGQPDVVLDWRKITCAGPLPRPFCGASMCSADAFLSGSFPHIQTPETLLALGVRLQPLSNGNMAIVVGGSLMDCQAKGLTACEFLFYWNGFDLTNLP